MPLISIVMPAYNAEKNISDSIHSIVDQGFDDYELVIVDDASTDSTLDILERFSESYPQVKVIHREQNQGDGFSRDTGINYVTGDWLIFLDSDDFLKSNSLFSLSEFISKSVADIVMYRFEMNDANNGKTWICEDVWPKERFPQTSFDPHDCPDPTFISFRSSVWNKCFRMDFVKSEHLVFQKAPRRGDILFALSAIAAAHRIDLFDEVLMTYWLNMNGSLSSGGDRYPDSFYNACDALHQSLVQRDEWQTYRMAFLNWLVENLPYNLFTMKTIEGYLELLELFKEKGFAQFEIDKTKRSDYISQFPYDHCMSLWRLSPEAGLFDSVKRQIDEKEWIASQRDEYRNQLNELKSCHLQHKLSFARRLINKIKKFCIE